MSSKSEQRKQLLQKRKALSETARHEASKAICDQLLKHPKVMNAASVHCYLSLPEEVDTTDFIEGCWRQNKSVVVPVTVKGSLELQHSFFSSWQHLEQGPFGVRQPAEKHFDSADIIPLSVVIVPGVGFDLQGNRLGYGKGYYDRFLAKTSAYHIGVAFQCQMLESIVTDPHDHPLHEVVTYPCTMP